MSSCHECARLAAKLSTSTQIVIDLQGKRNAANFKVARELDITKAIAERLYNAFVLLYSGAGRPEGAREVYKDATAWIRQTPDLRKETYEATA
jgi:hypothetical protein